LFSKLIREPLVHFLIGAFFVFVFFAVTGLDRNTEDYSVRLDQADVSRLASTWQQNFRRPPAKQELDGLIDQEIREEIYYREALRLGMNVNDAVIRRRLAKKMKFLQSEDGEDDKPTDLVLKKWLDDHPKKYALSSRYDLEQIYLGQFNDVDAKRAKRMIAQLNAGTAKPGSIRKPLSLPESIENENEREISRQFGEKFALAIGEQKRGEWTGPVLSGFGLHIIRITAKQPGQMPTLDQVKQAVTNDWRARQTKDREDNAYQKLLQQYDVQVAGR